MKKPFLTIAALGYFGIFLALTGWLWLLSPGAALAPAQPIPFPHTIHADTLNLPCAFCHAFAERSREAGAPPLELCMGCHRTIATEREAIRTLTRHYEEKRPVEWARVHNLPDFIYFSHKRHVAAGVECRECHGDVARMEKVRRVSTLGMGWCVSCHTVREAPLDCATCHL